MQPNVFAEFAPAPHVGCQQGVNASYMNLRMGGELRLATDAWLESPSLVLLSEGVAYWPSFRALLVQGRIAGPKVHDARIAARCRANGVSTLLTADRDFSRFPELRTRNPLVG